MVVKLPVPRDERVRTPCMNKPPETMFPESGRDKWAEPRKVCAKCPPALKVKCLIWALRMPEDHGMWAGTTPTERRKIRRQKGWP